MITCSLSSFNKTVLLAVNRNERVLYIVDCFVNVWTEDEFLSTGLHEDKIEFRFVQVNQTDQFLSAIQVN